jgi:hypothetical protein
MEGMARREVVEQLEQRVAEAVERALAGARRELAERVRDANTAALKILDEARPELPGRFLEASDLAPLQADERTTARAAALSDLAGAVARIDRASSQAGILEALLEAAGGFASRAALFLTGPESARGWAGRGFGEPSRVPGLEISYDSPPWTTLRQGQGCVELSAVDCAAFSSRLESPSARGGALVPLVLRDRVAAALYADRLEDESPWTLAGLQVLVHMAGLAIETLPFRARPATPTLALAAEAAGPGLGLWEEEAEAETAAEAVSTAVAEPLAPSPPESAAPEPELPAAAAGFSFASDTDEVAPSFTPAEDAVRWEPIEGLMPSARPDDVGIEPPPPAFAAPEPYAPYEPQEPQRTEIAAAPVAEAAEEPTLRLPHPSFPAAAPPEPPPLPPIQMPGSIFPAVGKSSEVAPPPDLEGPGWAFSGGRLPAPGSDEGLHEEARRLARLLVSEIKLYNEEQVEDGRRSRDLYERLREDIDRSRQMYEERVDERIRNTTDYFYQALVSILAGGDAKAMGA